MGRAVVGFEAFCYGLAYPSRLFSDLLKGEGIVALVVSCWAVDLSNFAVGELVMPWSSDSIMQFDTSVDEDDVCVLQSMSAALGHLDEVDFLLDSAPHIRRNIRNIDLFGQLDNER